MTLVVVLVELAIAAIAGITFMLLYGARSRWRQTSMGRHVMVFTAVMTLDSLALLAVGLGIRIPVWVFAVLFLGLDAVIIQRLVLLVRVQHSERHATMVAYPPDKEDDQDG